MPVDTFCCHFNPIKKVKRRKQPGLFSFQTEMSTKSLSSISCVVQVNLFQKLSSLNQLTHNMIQNCSLNSPKNTSSQHVVYKYCFECQNKTKTIFVRNIMWTCIFRGIQWTISYCGLTDSRMRASEKYLPVLHIFFSISRSQIL